MGVRRIEMRMIEMRMIDMRVIVSLFVAIFVMGIGTAQAGPCSPELRDRTPTEVLADLRADIAAQDWDAVACNYKKTAFVIDDQGILLGREDIVAAIQYLYDLFDGVEPTIIEDSVFNNTVRSLYTIDAGWIVMNDGVSTYFIKKGKIKWQTNHGLIEFTGAPAPGR